MKRGICILLILLLALSLGACGSDLPASSGTDGMASETPSDTKDGDTLALDGSSPEPSLSEEQMIAMWKAVIEETSKDDLTQEQALERVTKPSSLKLLETCGAELLALELPDKEARWTVKPLYESWMALYQTTSKSLMDFESESCHRLLAWKIVEDIQIEGDKVRFSIGGAGFGSQTDYFDVYYLPSDDVKSCIGYQTDLKFEERDGGWFAKADGDNTAFYRQLGEHLYFVALHF